MRTCTLIKKSRRAATRTKSESLVDPRIKVKGSRGRVTRASHTLKFFLSIKAQGCWSVHTVAVHTLCLFEPHIHCCSFKPHTHTELSLMPMLCIFKVHCSRQCHDSLTVNIQTKRWLRKSMFDDSHRGVKSVCVCGRGCGCMCVRLTHGL